MRKIAIFRPGTFVWGIPVTAGWMGHARVFNYNLGKPLPTKIIIT